MCVSGKQHGDDVVAMYMQMISAMQTTLRGANPVLMTTEIPSVFLHLVLDLQSSCLGYTHCTLLIGSVTTDLLDNTAVQVMWTMRSVTHENTTF